MAFTAGWNVVFGEVVTAAKWNQLGANDDALRNGSAFSLNNNVIPANALATNAITLGYVQITSNVTTTNTTATQAGALTASVTVPAGSRKVEIEAFATNISNSSSANGSFLTLWDGAVGSGTQIQQANFIPATNIVATIKAVVSPSAGSKTYSLGFATITGGTTTLSASSTGPAYLIVKAI